MNDLFFLNQSSFRIIGDVHGDLNAFRHAIETDRFIIQLGDLVDYGPSSIEVMKLMLNIQERKRGLFLLGNHDRKLGQVLKGRKVKRDAALNATLEQLSKDQDTSLPSKILNALEQAPVWIILKKFIFVHGGFHTRMLTEPPPQPLGPMTSLMARAIYGETTNKILPDGYPLRLLNWINHILENYMLYCGHDCRSTDGRPWIRKGYGGGTAIFMDTGASKGGHLSWIDVII